MLKFIGEKVTKSYLLANIEYTASFTSCNFMKTYISNIGIILVLYTSMIEHNITF